VLRLPVWKTLTNAGCFAESVLITRRVLDRNRNDDPVGEMQDRTESALCEQGIQHVALVNQAVDKFCAEGTARSSELPVETPRKQSLLCLNQLRTAGCSDSFVGVRGRARR